MLVFASRLFLTVSPVLVGGGVLAAGGAFAAGWVLNAMNVNAAITIIRPVITAIFLALVMFTRIGFARIPFCLKSLFFCTKIRIVKMPTVLESIPIRMKAV